jgi:hypothetical protein
MRFWKEENMLHLDEGELHALLDCAYPQDASEALQMQAHLDECAQCRARLEEERALRDRAALILRAARPGSEEVPPFERVLQRANQPKRRVGSSAPARLAWAASIMLALGAGWISRGMFPTWWSSRSARQETMQSESVSPAVPVPAPAPAPAQVAPAEARDLSETAARERDQVVTQPPPQTGQGVRGAQARGAAAPTVQADQANAPLTRRENAAVADGRRAADSASNKVLATPPPPAAPPPSAAPAAQRAAEGFSVAQGAVAGFAAPLNWTYSSPGEAQNIAGRKPLIIDDLEVVNVGVADRAGVWLFRVTQRLPDGNTIELIEEPVVERENRSGLTERAAFSARALTEESARLDETGTLLMTLRRGDLKITARATLPRDSLRALLERLR